MIRQSKNGDVMVEKFAIFIDMKKTKANQGGSGARKSSGSGPKKAGALNHPHNWVDKRKPDLDYFLSDEDHPDSEKALKISRNRSNDDFRKVQGKDVFLSQTIKSENPDLVLTAFKADVAPSPTEAAKAGLVGKTETIRTPRSSTPHFVKHINRDGKVIKVWECGICSRNFQHQYTLMRHLPTHTNVRNFVCNECGKAFRQLSTLSQHRAIHSVDRPYACETCNKSFNRISTLISHRKTHSDVKPFRCHMCNKGFHQKGNLRNHIYIHTNERPYRCGFCNKGFNQMSNLVCHTQKSHSSENRSVWTCHGCNMSFSKRTLLRAHELETHHIDDSGVRSNRMKSSNSRKASSSSSSDESQPSIDNYCKSEISDGGIVISAIETDAMKIARTNNEMPFAVLHFSQGLPLLVRIIEQDNHLCLLRPANADDFKLLRCQQPMQPETVSVAIVATVYQTLNESGVPGFTVTPPKNIYKLVNPHQTISLTDDNEKKFLLEESEELPLENVISLTPPHIPNDLRDVTIGSLESPLFETLAPVKDEPSNMDENCMDYSSGSIDEKPRAIAIVEDATWWKKQHKADPYDEPDVFSETFQNIATGCLLTPKKITESDIMPDQNASILDISGATSSGTMLNYNTSFTLSTNSNNNQLSIDDIEKTDCFNSFLSAVENEGIDLHMLRNLFSENRNFLNDFKECVSEILH